MKELLALYHEVVNDHSRHPRHFGELLSATHEAEGSNPSCGDHIKLYIILVEQTIRTIQFSGSGCALCMASASLLTEHLLGKSLLQVQDNFAAFFQMIEQGNPTEDSSLGKLKIFANVHNFPLQVKCATLPWHALKVALIKESIES